MWLIHSRPQCKGVINKVITDSHSYKHRLNKECSVNTKATSRITYSGNASLSRSKIFIILCPFQMCRFRICEFVYAELKHLERTNNDK